MLICARRNRMSCQSYKWLPNRPLEWMCLTKQSDFIERGLRFPTGPGANYTALWSWLAFAIEYQIWHVHHCRSVCFYRWEQELRDVLVQIWEEMYRTLSVVSLEACPDIIKHAYDPQTITSPCFFFPLLHHLLWREDINQMTKQQWMPHKWHSV